LPESNELLGATPHTINVGLEVFADTLHDLGFPVVQVDWRPPAGGDKRLTELLSRLEQPGNSNPGNTNPEGPS